MKNNPDNKDTRHDDDNPEWTEEKFASAKTMVELAKTEPFFTKLLDAHKNGTLTVRPVGRPKSDNPKRTTTIRLSPEVMNYFKRDGKGWQTRINQVLQDYVQSQR